jgi:hypothetical protein
MTTQATDRPEWKDEQTMTDTGPVRLPGAELARLLGNALPFAGTDETLPMLCAVRLRAAGDVLTAEATDRFAVIRETFPLTAPAAGLDMAVPLSAVRHLRRLLSGLPRAARAFPVELTVTDTTVPRGPAAPVSVPVLRFAAPAEGVSMEITGVGGFPDTDAVFARYDAYTAEHDTAAFDVRLNPLFLGRLAKLRPGDRDDGPSGLRLTQPTADRMPGEPTAPLHAVHAAVGGRIRVLIMPMRHDSADTVGRAA